MNKFGAPQERRGRLDANNVAKSSSPTFLLTPFYHCAKSYLFDHPSAVAIIAVRGAVLMLIGRHGGVVASCDDVHPDSTRARLCTLVAGLCPMVAVKGA